MLTIRDEPYQYRLSAARVEPDHELLLHVRRDTVRKINAINVETRLQLVKQEEFQYADFQGALEPDKGFGFSEGRLNVTAGEQSDLVLHIPLPLCEEDGDECQECSGHGYDYDDDKCRHCFGKGKHIHYLHDGVRAICCNLSILLNMFNALRPDKDTLPIGPPQQLLHVQTAIYNNAAPLYGEFSGQLVDWLGGAERMALSESLVRSMLAASDRMLPSFADNRIMSDYGVTLESGGWLAFGCHGDRCLVHPTDRDHQRRLGHGYRLSCHNVDTPHQQLTLLTGLGALSDLAVAGGADYR